MRNSNLQFRRKTPWHLWVVGTVALLWSAMGALDYIMTKTQNETYMSNFSQEQLNFFYSLPSWAVASWAIAVWGGVFGAIFLLLKKRIAVPMFLVSLIAALITTFRNYVLSNGMEIMGDAFSLLFTGLIFILSLVFYFYAKSLRQKGVLR